MMSLNADSESSNHSIISMDVERGDLNSLWIGASNQSSKSLSAELELMQFDERYFDNSEESSSLSCQTSGGPMGQWTKGLDKLQMEQMERLAKLEDEWNTDSVPEFVQLVDVVEHHTGFLSDTEFAGMIVRGKAPVMIDMMRQSGHRDSVDLEIDSEDSSGSNSSQSPRLSCYL